MSALCKDGIQRATWEETILELFFPGISPLKNPGLYWTRVNQLDSPTEGISKVKLILLELWFQILRSS